MPKHLAVVAASTDVALALDRAGGLPTPIGRRHERTWRATGYCAHQAAVERRRDVRDGRVPVDRRMTFVQDVRFPHDVAPSGPMVIRHSRHHRVRIAPKEPSESLACVGALDGSVRRAQARVAVRGLGGEEFADQTVRLPHGRAAVVAAAGRRARVRHALFLPG